MSQNESYPKTEKTLKLSQVEWEDPVCFVWVVLTAACTSGAVPASPGVGAQFGLNSPAYCCNPMDTTAIKTEQILPKVGKPAFQSSVFAAPP